MMLCTYSIGAPIGAGPLSKQNHYHSLYDGFENDCLNFADVSICFYLFLGRMELIFTLKECLICAISTVMATINRRD